MAMSLDHSEDPRVVLAGAVNGGGRGGIHAVHPIFIKLVLIPQLIVMGRVVLVVRVHVLRTQEIVVFFLFHILTDDDFELCAEDDGKAIAAYGLLYASDCATLTPFVEFTAEGISL